jgi:hypothetical protein
MTHTKFVRLRKGKLAGCMADDNDPLGFKIREEVLELLKTC